MTKDELGAVAHWFHQQMTEQLSDPVWVSEPRYYHHQQLWKVCLIVVDHRQQRVHGRIEVVFREDCAMVQGQTGYRYEYADQQSLQQLVRRTRQWLEHALAQPDHRGWP